MKVAVHRGKCCAFGRSRHLLLENWSFNCWGKPEKILARNLQSRQSRNATLYLVSFSILATTKHQQEIR